MNRSFAVALGVAGLLVASAALATEAMPGASTSTKSTSHSSSKSHHSEMVNLNSASKEQIERLPGVTPETADKIIAGRPFKSTNELVSKKILAESEYKKIHSKVTVKHT